MIVMTEYVDSVWIDMAEREDSAEGVGKDEGIFVNLLENPERFTGTVFITKQLLFDVCALIWHLNMHRLFW
jgi:hypothetical protein